MRGRERGAFNHAMTSIAAPSRTRAPARAALSPAERTALACTVAVTAGFGLYGLATGAPSTVAYVATVSALVALVVRLRRSALPGSLALGLAALTFAHLAGGLVRVGHGVLYNASAWTKALQYDHLVHASAIFVGTLLVWTMFAPWVSASGPGRRPALLALWALGGLGLGAVNETIEFLVTLAHDGSHVGGYANTGWDLVSNVVGATAAAVVVAHACRGRRSCAG